MNKQAKYWITGVIAVVIIGVIWFSMGNSSDKNRNVDHNSGQGSTSKEQVQGTNLKSYMQDQDNIMEKMMTDMQNIKHTGDPAIDFLYGMIPHHESAIAMAESLLKYGGENAEIKKMAKDIIHIQTSENEEMNKFIKELEASPKVDEAKAAAYLKEYNKMFESGAHESHQMSNPKSVDQAFAEGMIMHHQMAIDMSETILNFTDNEKIRKLAQDIIDTQKVEIKQMEDILNTMR